MPLPGKRRWHRIVDTATYEKRPREDNEEESITDRTRLLASEVSQHPNPNPSFPDAEDTLLWKHDKIGKSSSCGQEPWFPPSTWDEDVSSIVTASSCSAGKNCGNSSWRGFKQLVKKQFMPSFAFGKDTPEEMLHLRQKRMEVAMNRAPCRVQLGASTNLVELRRLDAKIQDGISNSAFRIIPKKAKENVVVVSVTPNSNGRVVEVSSQSSKGLGKFDANVMKKKERQQKEKWAYIVPPCKKMLSTNVY